MWSVPGTAEVLTLLGDLAMNDLHDGTGRPSTFDDVLERAEVSRDVLDIEASG